VEPVEYLRALRQWWFIIVALTLLGLFAGAFSASSAKARYSATHTLEAPDGTTPVALNRAAFLTTTGPVPRLVAAKLGGDPEALASSVGASANPGLEAVQVTASGATPGRASQLADTFAEQLVASLDQTAAADYDASVTKAKQTAAQASTALAQAGPNPSETVQRNADQATRALADLQSSGPPTSGFTTIGNTVVSSSGAGGSRAATRAAIGGFMGLLLGVIVALVLARFDTRIRSRENADEAFGFPVISEVPLFNRHLRGAHEIVTSKDPESLAAESYRSLRTALVVAATAKRRSTTVEGNGAAAPGTGPARVIMVVSPGTGEGKTTTVANLAVAFAESGRRVLLLGMDLRRPELHGYFGIDEGPGLTDVLSQTVDGPSFDAAIQATEFPGVQIVPSGQPVEHPGELIARGPDVIARATERADIVIVDTAPLLATDDASVLMPAVDEVVVVCRAGRTPMEGARLASDLLTRLDAPVVGVALIGAPKLQSARSYYRTDYRSRHRNRPAPVATAETDASAESGSEPAEPIAPATANGSAPPESQPGTEDTAPQSPPEVPSDPSTDPSSTTPAGGS
jgi:capsular exopolysaccharide synthesis family protein